MINIQIDKRMSTQLFTYKVEKIKILKKGTENSLGWFFLFTLDMLRKSITEQRVECEKVDKVCIFVINGYLETYQTNKDSVNSRVSIFLTYYIKRKTLNLT